MAPTRTHILWEITTVYIHTNQQLTAPHNPPFYIQISTSASEHDSQRRLPLPRAGPKNPRPATSQPCPDQPRGSPRPHREPIDDVIGPSRRARWPKMGMVDVGVGSGAPGGRGTPRWVPLRRISDNARISEGRQRGFGGVRDHVERRALASGLVSTTSPSTRPDPCVADLNGCRWRASRGGNPPRPYGCQLHPESLARHRGLRLCRRLLVRGWLSWRAVGSICVVAWVAAWLASAVVRVALALAVAVVRRLVRWSWRGLRRLSWSAARLVPFARSWSG